MLSEAKDTSELMVDLAYAALFFGDAGMADEVHELEELLSEHLATRVRVQEGRTGGKVVVEFADLDDLERIYRAMTEPGERSTSEDARTSS